MVVLNADQCVRNWNRSNNSNTKGRKSHSRSLSIKIELKMHKSFWKHKQVCGKKLIGCVHKLKLRCIPFILRCVSHIFWSCQTFCILQNKYNNCLFFKSFMENSTSHRWWKNNESFFILCFSSNNFQGLTQ